MFTQIDVPLKHQIKPIQALKSSDRRSLKMVYVACSDFMALTGVEESKRQTVTDAFVLLLLHTGCVLYLVLQNA